MAKKPSVNRQENEPTLIERPSVQEQLQEEEVEQLADYVRDTGMRGGQVVISRKRPFQAKPGYLVTLSPEDATEENIAQLYGGGEYYCKLRTSEGAYFGHTGFSVDMTRKGSIEVNAEAEQKKEAHANGATTVQVLPSEPKKDNSEMLQFMMMMNQQNQAAAERSDKMLATMMTSMSQMFTALKPEPAAKSDFQFKDMLPIVLELFKSKSSLKEHVETMKALQDLNADGKDEPDMMEKLIKNFGPMAAQFLGSKMPGMTAPQPPHLQILPAPDGQPIAPSKPLEGGANAEPTNQNVPIKQPETAGAVKVQEPFGILWMDPAAKGYMGVMLKAARKNSEPSTYADLIADMMDDQRWEKLIEHLESPNWFVELFGDSPDLVSQKSWFDRLRTELLAIAYPQEEAQPAVEVQAEPEPAVQKIENARKKK